MIRGLIGKSLVHSYSKEINELISDSPYSLFNVSNVNEFLAKSRESNDSFGYLNITIPYKNDVIPYLDYTDMATKRINACNLIINFHNKFYGYNTDYYAFEKMLDDEKIKVSGKNVLVLGTGGSSKMVNVYLKNKGAKTIFFVSRMTTDENTITYISLENNTQQVQEFKKKIQIIINCTPVGTYPCFLDKRLDLKDFTNLEHVIDIIYNPFRTRLLQEAEEKKVPICNGLKMLIYQAIFNNYLYEEMQRRDYNVTSSMQIVELDGLIDQIDIEKYHFSLIEQIIKQKRNIVLIGMSGVGKSTIAKKLGSYLECSVEDTDEMIVKKYGGIKDIFVSKGEKYFRTLEHEMIVSSSQKHNCIIATGGGVINNEENIILLKANGLIIYLERDIDKIVVDDLHPLVKTEEEKIALFKERQCIYNKYCDVKVINNDIETTIKEILEIIRTY